MMGLSNGFASKTNNWQDGVFNEKQKEFLVSMFNNSTPGYDHMNTSTFGVFNVTNTNLSMDDSMANVTDKLFDWEPWRDVLATVNKALMGVVLFIIMFTMGCKLYWRKVLQDMRHPVGIFIGMLCQFVLLPAVAFSLAKAMALTKYETLGVLIMSCAPGGGISNFVAYNIDGDLTLSIAMTTISSIMAMIVMPGNLWIYSHFLDDNGGESLVIPYMNLFLSLVGIVVPVALGMLIRTWFPKCSAFLSKVLAIVTYFVLAAAVTSTVVLYYPVYAKASVFIISTALLLPLLGFTTSYLVAMILRQSHQRARTIGVETGCQNVPCVMSIILFSFTDKKAIASMIVFPNLYGFITVIILFTSMAFYKLWKQYCRKEEEDKGDSIENGALLKEINKSVINSKTKPRGGDIVTEKCINTHR